MPAGLEQRLSDTFDAVDDLPPDAIRIAEALNRHSVLSITDAHGVILHVNDAFCSLSGYARDELLGKSHSIVRSERHTEQFFRRMWDSLAAGEGWQGLLCNRTKSGEKYWVQTTITPVFGEDQRPEYYIAIHTDVTRMKRSEQDHQRNTWLLMLLHGHTSALLDAAPGEQRQQIKRVVTEWREALAADLGMLVSVGSPEEPLRVEHQCPQARPGLQRDLEHLRDTEALAELAAADGPRISLLRVGTPMGALERAFAAHGFEVTVVLPVGENQDRHDTIVFAWHDQHAASSIREQVYLFNLLCDLVVTAQQRLRNEAWLKNHTEIQDARQYLAQLGDWDMDVASLEVSWSPELFGLPKSHARLELAGFIEFVHPEDRRRFLNELNKCINHHVPASFEFRLSKGGGETIWVLMRGARMRNRARRTDTLVTTLIDVTQHKHTEIALKRATAQAEMANQAKSQFLSNMSHELRTPLNSILGFGQLLDLDDALDADQKENVSEIIRSGKHLLELINEVLDLSLIESGRPNLVLERVPIAEVIEESLAMIRQLARQRNIQLRVDKVSTESIFVDRVRLKQALINLLSNAVKYNRPGGCVCVRTAATDDERLVISVEDSGIGIDIDQQEDLFTPFERLGQEQTTTEGTGIGLPFTKSVIELMGGEISFESTPGEGTTFFVTFALPATPPRVMVSDVHPHDGDDVGAAIEGLDENAIAVIDRGSEGADLVREAIGDAPAAAVSVFEPGYPFEKLRGRVDAQIVVVHAFSGEGATVTMELLQELESVFHDPWMIALVRAEDYPSFVGLATHFDYICLLPIDVAKLKQTIQRVKRQVTLSQLQEGEPA